jgi:hypothetical protein
VANFFEFQSDTTFDLVMALGVLDYVKDAHGYLQKMKKFAQKEVIASFPAAEDMLFLQRRLRYKYLKHCDIYSYSKEHLSDLAARCGFSSYLIKRIGRDYLFLGYLPQETPPAKASR